MTVHENGVVAKKPVREILSGVTTSIAVLFVFVGMIWQMQNVISTSDELDRIDSEVRDLRRETGSHEMPYKQKSIIDTSANSHDDLLDAIDRRDFLRARIKQRAAKVSFAALSAEFLAMIAGLLFIYRDRSRERRLVEQTLEADARLREFFDQASEGIFNIDIEGQFVDVNRVGCQLLGYTRLEFQNLHVSQIVAPQELERIKEVRDLLVGREVPHHVGEWNLKRKDGSLVPTELSLRMSSGFQFQGFVRDLTQSKEIYRRHEVLAKLSNVLMSSIHASQMAQNLVTFVASEVCDWCSLSVVGEGGQIERNSVAHRDQSKSELIEEYKNSSIGASAQVFIREVIESKSPKIVSDPDLIESLTSKELLGLLRRIGLRSFAIVPLTGKQNIGAMTFFSSERDLCSEDMRFFLQIANLAALSLENAALFERAEGAIKAREDVIEIVSHDLKNPLAAVQTGVQFLRRFDLSQFPEESRLLVGQRLDGILRSLRRAFELIDNFLDVTKIETGNLVLCRQPLSPKMILDSAVEVIGPLASQQAVEIKVQTHCEDMVWADPNRIAQVLWNLLGNAIRHSPQNGQVLLQAARIQRGVCFVVSDSGPGIERDHIPHIFNRYWQASRTNRQTLGLGLSISKGIILAHGGDIWVESERGQGATFKFVLPAVETS